MHIGQDSMWMYISHTSLLEIFSHLNSTLEHLYSNDHQSAEHPRSFACALKFGTKCVLMFRSIQLIINICQMWQQTIVRAAVHIHCQDLVMHRFEEYSAPRLHVKQ